jgi:Ni,Fe-hydrogenase I large subunit
VLKGLCFANRLCGICTTRSLAVDTEAFSVAAKALNIQLGRNDVTFDEFQKVFIGVLRFWPSGR